MLILYWDVLLINYYERQMFPMDRKKVYYIYCAEFYLHIVSTGVQVKLIVISINQNIFKE